MYKLMIWCVCVLQNDYYNKVVIATSPHVIAIVCVLGLGVVKLCDPFSCSSKIPLLGMCP